MVDHQDSLIVREIFSLVRDIVVVQCYSVGLDCYSFTTVLLCGDCVVTVWSTHHHHHYHHSAQTTQSWPTLRAGSTTSDYYTTTLLLLHYNSTKLLQSQDQLLTFTG